MGVVLAGDRDGGLLRQAAVLRARAPDALLVVVPGALADVVADLAVRLGALCRAAVNRLHRKRVLAEVVFADLLELRQRLGVRLALELDAQRARRRRPRVRPPLPLAHVPAFHFEHEMEMSKDVRGSESNCEQDSRKM